jgi:L-alanine-DL-glutamate epimerase-like enolase superfamily enzyme
MMVVLVHSMAGLGTKAEGWMRITRIRAYALELPRGARFMLSGGRAVTAFDTTVTVVDTDAGITGMGEVCPLGSAYLPAYAAGARTGIAELAPALIGADPRELDVVNRRMDTALMGHPYVKSALDIACWDILGQAAGLSVCTLLGGRQADAFDLYQPVSRDTPRKMVAQMKKARAQGFRIFQPKVGGENADDDIERIRALAAALEPGERMVCDANGGWTAHQAARLVRGVRDLDFVLEQPCATYEECLTIRRRTDRPLVLDEVIDSVPALLRAHADGAMDAINLKISKLGGLTRARRFRDLCVALGIPMTIEDSGGGDVVAAAVASLAQSTPPPMLFSVANAYFVVKVHVADGCLCARRGRVTVSDRPGLGLTPRFDVLGVPVVDVRKSA